MLEVFWLGAEGRRPTWRFSTGTACITNCEGEFHREGISFNQVRLIAVVEPLLYTTKG